MQFKITFDSFDEMDDTITGYVTTPEVQGMEDIPIPFTIPAIMLCVLEKVNPAINDTDGDSPAVLCGKTFEV